MQRFSSLDYAPAETRRLLRERFARHLTSPHNAFFGGNKLVMLADEALLDLFLNLSIDFESALDQARATYEALRVPNPNEPSFEALITAGWVRVAWARVFTPFEIAKAASSASVGTMTAFTTLMTDRHKQTCCVANSARSNHALTAVIATIDNSELAPRDIGCQTPDWVAARLWDRSPMDDADRSSSLRVWVDRWEELGSPSLVPCF